MPCRAAPSAGGEERKGVEWKKGKKGKGADMRGQWHSEREERGQAVWAKAEAEQAELGHMVPK